MEPTPATPAPDATIIATAMLASNLARQGFTPDPAVAAFLGETDAFLTGATAPVPVPSAGGMPTLGEYLEAEKNGKLNFKVLKQQEIAAFMLANQGMLSIKEVADKFGVTPATITRIMGTDGFQYILAQQAKSLAVTFKSARSE